MRLDKVKGVLFDIDGVVHVGDSPVAGATDALHHLRDAGIPYRFVTNTTTQSRRALALKLQAMGLEIDEAMILTTHEIAAEYLKSLGRPSCYLLVADDVRAAYAEFPQPVGRPDVVVIGDIGNRWNYDVLNRVFSMVMDGSDMVALHRGRYWRTERGLQLDIGAFVTGLEYATGKTAVVVGKPSPAFFAAAVERMGLAKSDVIMIGDDIETDVGGAQQAGIRGILVKTGKYRDDAVARSAVRPDAVIDSIADLPALIIKGTV